MSARSTRGPSDLGSRGAVTLHAQIYVFWAPRPKLDVNSGLISVVASQFGGRNGDGEQIPGLLNLVKTLHWLQCRPLARKLTFTSRHGTFQPYELGRPQSRLMVMVSERRLCDGDERQRGGRDVIAFIFASHRIDCYTPPL